MTHRTTHFGLSMLICCLAFCYSGSAQINNDIWHKQVYRIIDLLPNTDTSKTQPITADTSDSGLMLLIANDVKAEKLRAFHPFDMALCHKLRKGDIQDIFADHPDTIIDLDKKTNEEHQVIEHHILNPRLIHEYRLQEDWNFDPASGITEIQVTGLTPMRDIYGDDGVYRGSAGIFSVCYCDAQSLSLTMK